VTRPPAIDAQLAVRSPTGQIATSASFGDVTPLLARGAVRRVFVALGPVLAAKARRREEFDRFVLIGTAATPMYRVAKSGRVADAGTDRLSLASA